MSDELQDKIAELRKEIQHIHFDEQGDKQHIDQLINEIENAENHTSEEKESLLNNIKSSVERFETEHPRATAIMNDIMVTLSNIGI